MQDDDHDEKAAPEKNGDEYFEGKGSYRPKKPDQPPQTRPPEPPPSKDKVEPKEQADADNDS